MIPVFIIFLLTVMNSTINFNNQFYFITVKIYDISVNRMLFPKS